MPQSSNIVLPEFQKQMLSISKVVSKIEDNIGNPVFPFYMLYAYYNNSFVDYSPIEGRNLIYCLRPKNKDEQFLIEHFAKEIEILSHENKQQVVSDFLTEMSPFSSDWWRHSKVLIIESLFHSLFLVEEGKMSGICELPAGISGVIATLINLTADDTVYNPFAGTANLALLCRQGAKYIGQELEPNMYAIGLLRKLLLGMPNSSLFKEDSIKDWGVPELGITKFDHIVSFPPIGLKLNRFQVEQPDITAKHRTIESFLIHKSIDTLKSHGYFVGILSPGVLTNSGEFLSLRRELVDSARVNTVVQLPKNLLKTTGIGLSILVLQKEPVADRKIRFIDATCFTQNIQRETILDIVALLRAVQINDPRFVKVIPIEKIVSQDYSLAPERYIKSIEETISIPEGFKLVELSEIATIDRGVDKELDECRVIRGKDLLSKGPIAPCLFDTISPEPLSKRRNKVLTKDALLLCKVGQLKPTLFAYNNVDFSLNPNVVALSLSDSVVAEYVVSELRKDYVGEQVTRMTYGMVIPSLTHSDILRIRILVPALSAPKEDVLSLQKTLLANQQRIEQEQRLKELHLEEYLKRTKDAIYNMMSIRKHRIKPYLSGLSSNVSMMLEDLNSYGQLKADHELSDGYTVKDALLNMEQNLSEVRLLFKALTTDIDTGEAEAIDLVDFIEHYRYSSKIPDRAIKVVPDPSINKSEFRPIVFNGENLREILDEIIFNAQKHFVPGSKNGLVMLTPRAETNTISLFISNNGTPVPDDFDEEASFNATYSLDENGTGMGLFRVRQVCDNFGATIEWANVPTSPMPVALHITFKISAV